MCDQDFHSALSKEEVLLTISKDLGSDNFKLIKYDLLPASDDMTGFLGVHFKIHAQVELNGELKKIQYFVKKMPMDIPAHNEYAKKTRAYFKEISFYQRVVEDIKNNMTPGRMPTKWCPEFFYARGEEIFVVEDLSQQGYEMLPDRQLLDLEHIFATMKAFAALHAGAWILEEKVQNGKAIIKGWPPGKTGNLGLVYSDIVYETETCGEPGHPGNDYNEAGIKSQLAIVDLLPCYTEEQRQKIKQRLPSTLRKMYEAIKPSTKYRNTWTHGDLWSNNVMFRESVGVLHALVLDFQLARYAPPAHDVMFFMHMVQNRAFREENLPKVLDRYYSAFSKELSAEGFDAENILPQKEFLESCQHYYELSLLAQVMYFQFILLPPRISEKYLTTEESFNRNFLEDRTDMVSEAFKTDEEFRTRVIEVMNELIEHYQLAD